MVFGTVCLKEALRNRLIDVECELAMVRCLDLAHRKLKELPEGADKVPFSDRLDTNIAVRIRLLD
jgi:hypothetical protein